MKKLILLFALVLSKLILFAQVDENSGDHRPLNNATINLFGDASIVSINYERLFLNSSNFFLSAKIGLGYNRQHQYCWYGGCPPLPISPYLTIPHHLTGNLGNRTHFFEFGFGGTAFNGESKESYLPSQNYMFYPIVGYRVQPLKSKKISFRIFVYFPITDAGDVEILFVPLGLTGIIHLPNYRV